MLRPDLCPGPSLILPQQPRARGTRMPTQMTPLLQMYAPGTLSVDGSCLLSFEADCSCLMAPIPVRLQAIVCPMAQESSMYRAQASWLTMPSLLHIRHRTHTLIDLVRVLYLCIGTLGLPYKLQCHQGKARGLGCGAHHWSTKSPAQVICPQSGLRSCSIRVSLIWEW